MFQFKAKQSQSRITVVVFLCCVCAVTLAWVASPQMAKKEKKEEKAEMVIRESVSFGIISFNYAEECKFRAPYFRCYMSAFKINDDPVLLNDSVLLLMTTQPPARAIMGPVFRIRYNGSVISEKTDSGAIVYNNPVIIPVKLFFESSESRKDFIECLKRPIDMKKHISLELISFGLK
jgi:hypothetical protein